MPQVKCISILSARFYPTICVVNRVHCTRPSIVNRLSSWYIWDAVKKDGSRKLLSIYHQFLAQFLSNQFEIWQDVAGMVQICISLLGKEKNIFNKITSFSDFFEEMATTGCQVCLSTPPTIFEQTIWNLINRCCRHCVDVQLPFWKGKKSFFFRENGYYRTTHLYK